MAGGLGEGFEHLLGLHNSLMTDALSKFDWASSHSAQRPVDSKHQDSAEMVNMDVRQVACALEIACKSLIANVGSASGPEHG
jgi:hypothetical protein